jgi:alkylated DNA repair dioxygenase AlkB
MFGVGPQLAIRSMTQHDLFGASDLPAGFQYLPDALSPAEERAVVARLGRLPFAPFEFHGFAGNRRVVSYGYRYDYGARQVRDSAALPSFLLGVRDRAAQLAAVPADRLQQLLVTEYAAGAGIGWHKDKPEFGEVVALSFVSACVLRFRRRSGNGWERRKLTVQPRSAYVLRGPVRWDWQHSIPPQPALRYSITFRTYDPKPG